LWYAQAQRFPFTMGNRWLILELPDHFRTDDLVDKQGLFVLRSFADSQNRSNLPYYRTAPSIRAFVPVSADGRDYMPQQARIFPLAKYASQLEAAGDLHVLAGHIEWRVDSAAESYKRRFIVHPDGSGQARLLIDVSNAVGRTRLTFGYAWEPGASALATTDRRLTLAVRGRTPTKTQSLLDRVEPLRDESAVRAVRIVDVDLTGLGIEDIQLSVDGAPPGVAVAIYELNLRADDFTR
jgi:hypothetical protein